MKKKIFSTLVLMITLTGNTAYASENRVINLVIGNDNATINGETVTIDVAPYILNDNTMIPLRFLANALDISNDNIIYTNENRTATVEYDGKILSFAVDEDFLTIETISNGEIVKNAMSNNARVSIKDDRVFVPLRPIAEAFGLGIEWNGETSTVTLTDMGEDDSSKEGQSDEIAKNENTSNSAMNSSTVSTEKTDNSNARKLEEELINLVNIERTKAGLSSLEIFEPAMGVAREKAESMAKLAYATNSDENGHYHYYELTDYLEGYGSLSQNIVSKKETPTQVLNTWLSLEKEKSIL